MCGADCLLYPRCTTLAGSPPRVRSRLQDVINERMIVGITSACAEQTWSRASGRWWRGDHLRVCGADRSGEWDAEEDRGSPPRVRSRPMGPNRSRQRGRITSACAEQTRRPTKQRMIEWDHLRVCGADPDGVPLRWLRRGITSACAEQTSAVRQRSRMSKDHLRVCGADRSGVEAEPEQEGSPPRVRSRPHHGRTRLRYHGITSACAEQTQR